MGLFDDLLEEDNIQTTPKRNGLFDDLLEEDEDIVGQKQVPTNDFFAPRPLKTEQEEKEIGTLEGISNAAKNAFDSSRQAMDVVGGVTPEEAKNIAKIEFDKKSRKLAPGYDEYQKAEGMDAVWAFAKNPIEVTSNIIAEGLAGSLPALGAGLVTGGVAAAAAAPTVIGAPVAFTGGQIAGTFAGSLATEYGSKVLEELQGEGMDISDPNSIQTFFSNEELMGKVRNKALTRGVPVAAFDAISAGIGGKLGRVFGTKVLTEGEKIIGKQFATKTGEAATELGVQAGLGGGGEVAGALAVGEPIEGKAVFGEVIGEVGPGSVEVLTGRIADQRAMAKTREEAKIKATSELSTKLEENSAPLTANVVTAKSATNIEQDKLAAQLEEELLIQETAAAAAQQQKQTDATKKIIQPEGVRQEPQDGTQIQQTAETIARNRVFGAEGIQEEGQVARDIVSELQAVSNNTATREQIARLSMDGLVDVRRGQAIINEDGEGILAQAQAQLPKLTPEERAAEVEATPRPLPTDALPTETPGAEYGRESELFDVFGGVRRRPVDVTEPTIGEIPQTSPMIGKQPAEPIISEKPTTSDIVGAEPATIVEQEQVAPVSQEFKDELMMSGVAYDGDTRYSVQQSSDGTFRAERIANGQREDIQIGLPDIETAQNVIINSVGKEPTQVPVASAQLVQGVTPEKPQGMSVEEGKAYLEERNKSTIFGYPTQDIMAMQQGKQVGRAIPSAAPAEAPAITPAPVAETPAVTEAPAAEIEQKPSKPLSVMEQAEANFTKKYGMTPDDARNKFLKEKKLTFEKLNKLPLDKQRELYQEYDSWKENLIVTPAAEPAGISEEVAPTPSPKEVSAIETPTTTNLRNKIKEAKGKDRQIVVMQAMADESFFSSAIEAAEFGKPFPSIGDTRVDYRLPDSIPQTIDTSKIKLQPIKAKPPETAASPMIGYDDNRWVLGGVYLDSTNNMVVATDGRALVAIPQKVTGRDKIVAERNIKKQGIKKGDLIEGNYPNWKQVVPTYGKDIQKVDIDIDDALKASTILDSINNTFNNKVGSSLIVFNDAKFDPKYILSSITALVESGAKSITAQIKSEADPLLLTGSNGAIAVVMPKRATGRITHTLKARSEIKMGATSKKVEKYDTQTLLNAAKPFSEYGANYNRNIAASYERLKSSIEKGSLESTIAYNAEELQIRLNKFEPEALANAMQEQIAPAGISVGNRIKLGKSPQTYIVEEAIPQSEVEKSNDEQFYSVKNERTGEVQVVEKADMKQVGGKRARRMAAATKLSDSLDSGEFNAAQALVDQGTTMDRETFIRSITPSATQRATTIHTRLEKDGIISKEEFSNGKGLVYGDGRGAASSYLGGQSYEPFPPAGFTPDYTGDRVAGMGDAIGEKFSTILNTFVLNVVDPQTRSFIVKDIANLLQNGGRAVFVTRGSDVANSKALVSFAPLERIQKSEGKLTYQKGFTQKELIQYLQETLGDGFTINGLRGGTASDVRVEVIKNTDAELNNPTITQDIRLQAAEFKNEEIVTPIPEANRYTFEEAVKAVDAHFGKQGIPEGVVIVNNTTEPDLEMKAGYFVNRGQIVINLAYIAKGENLGDIIDHELGHYIFGDPEFQADFKQFWELMTPEEKVKADQIISQFYNKETGAIQMEEKQIRAFMQLIQDSKAMPKWKQLLDKIKRWINEKLGTNLQVNDRGALAVLAAAHKRFKSGEQIIREIDSGVLKTAETAQDADYLAAVDRGDMETAQRMVDEAAKRAGYDIEAYHGSDEWQNDKDDFVEFNQQYTAFGYYFAPDERAAEYYAPKGVVKKIYLKIPKLADFTNPQDFNKIAEEAIWETDPQALADEISKAYDAHEAGGSNWYMDYQDDFVKTASNLGYDGVFMIDASSTGTPESYVIFDPQNAKLSLPVTYDDAGNVIPLSQRFRATSPDIRRMAAEPRREQVAGKERGDIITTPEGIIKQTNEVLRKKFFDGSEVSDEATLNAWNYIEQMLDIKSGAANDLAGQINDVVDQETNSDTRIGASLFSVSLANYAAKLAAQGDTTMISYLIRRINRMPIDKLAGGISEAAAALRAKREYNIDGFNTLKTEGKSKVERTAATLFGTDRPSEEQVKSVDDAIKASEDTSIGEPEEVVGEIEKVEKRTGRKIVKKIEDKIKESTEPKKEELLISFQNLNADKKIKGIKLTYSPKKVNPSKNIKDFIIGKLADYRKTLVNQGAGGLESTFWQTMSDQERKEGPLAELDKAQNNELAKIVQKTLIDLGLKGEPKNTKMTDIEKVASILNENKLSDEKRIEADQRIVAEIERRREGELAAGYTPEAVNAKYDIILDAWNQSMSRQLNMPVSDNMLQRLISSELKEQKKKISELIDEPDGKVTAETKRNIVDSIIRKIYGVSKEFETGIEMDENYDGLKGYLEQSIDNMYARQIEKKNAAYAKRQAKISLRNNVEGQAQSIIDQLANQLSDTPAFPKKEENQIKAIVQQDLRQKPRMNRKEAWTNQLTAKLIQAGASEAQALTISDLVWRQHEIKAMDRELKELQTAAEKGSLAVIIQRIKDTPLEDQQKPEWMQGVIREYLVEAGLSNQAADTAARLYESVIAERFAEAKQKAFEATLAKSAPWNNYLSRNAQLGKNALKKIQDAIRTGVLDPTQTTEGIIAKENGWSGFSKEQLTRIVQLDGVLSDENANQVDKAEAMSELNKIIVKAKMPVRFRDAISSYYVGQALMGIPTFTVNIASPTFFAVRNFATDVIKYAATDPRNIPVAFQSFINSFQSLYDNSMYAFKNQIYISGEIEYMQGQNVLSELFDKGKDQWAKGDYANGMFNMLVGATQITGRILSSLDQGAIEMMQSQNITRYTLEAMKGNRNIPKEKHSEIVNIAISGRRKIREELIASGMAPDRAGVLAELKVRSELTASLSEVGVRATDVLNASLNDALQSVGRNRAITINSLKQEQNNLRDAGILSGLAIGFLENIAQGASKSSQSQQVFAKMLYGFALVPARVFSTAAWFSPIGFVRLGIDAALKSKGIESRYALSLATELQQKQRFIEAVAGSALLFGLGAALSSSTDDDEDEFFKIVVTGNGPDYNVDKQYHDSWHKNHTPQSVEIWFGKTKTTFNIGRGGEAISIPLLFLGGLDDARIKQKLNQARKSPADFEMVAEALGSAFYGLAQRGPFAAFTKPLFDAKQSDKFVPKLFGQVGFLGKTFVPVLGTSIARNISDFINDPVDKSSVQGAIYSNIPIVGPVIGTKALNALGQPIRADDWGDKMFKLGSPLVFSFPKNTPENELNQLILKKGDGPPIPTRTNAQKKFEEPLTDKEFEIYVREYGRVISDKMFKNRKRLETMDAKNYTKELDKYVNGYSIDGIKVNGASDMAVRAVKRLRNE